MSKNTKADKITKATIAENLDKTAIDVSKNDDKANKSKTEKLLSLFGGSEHFAAASDADQRKLLDLCITAINKRIGELKAENKALPKEDRKPLKESPLYNGLRSLLGLASAMRSRLRTDSEKDAAKAEAAEKRAENEEKILEKAIDAGKVISADDIQNVKTCTSLEEGVLCLIEMARKCNVSLASLQSMIERRF